MTSLSPNFTNITVNLPGVGVAPQTFNVGLILGTSTAISAATRVKTYANLAAVLADGFANNSPEYLAAQLYFSATSQPNLLAIGRKDLTASETSLAALQACRAANSQWYCAYDTSAADSDQAAIAAWVETQTAPYTQYFCQTSTSAVKAGTAGNIFETLKGGNYSRTQGLFSSFANAMAGMLGYIAGQASSLAGSQFTQKFKTLPGVTAEALTETQVTAIENNNGNVYINRGVSMYEQGRNFNGQFFDEVLGLDMLANDIQVAVTNLLFGATSIPQTEGGVAQIRAVIAKACNTAVARGFIAPGQWTGSPVLSLATGDYLPAGYLILSDSIDGQSTADRTNRIAPNIYVCIKLAGAIHSVVLKVNVNR